MEVWAVARIRPFEAVRDFSGRIYQYYFFATLVQVDIRVDDNEAERRNIIRNIDQFVPIHVFIAIFKDPTGERNRLACRVENLHPIVVIRINLVDYQRATASQGRVSGFCLRWRGNRSRQECRGERRHDRAPKELILHIYPSS